MKLLTSLVAVKKIVCNSPRSLFVDEDIEQAAKLILASRGVINPIIIRRTSLKSYEVVDGVFEYYAAARAREIDPEKGEMIGVFIVEEDNEELLNQQVKTFRKDKSIPIDKPILEQDVLNNFLNNLESRFDKITNKLLEEATEKVKLEYQVKDLQTRLLRKAELLELFNNLDASQLTSQLKLASNKSNAIVTERKKQKFKSLKDVVDRVKIKKGKRVERAITEKKMLDIVDSCLNDSEH